MTRATATLAAGVGVGAGLMYYFDPDRGSRRRTHLRNQMIHTSHQLRDVAGTRGRDLGHRTAGVVARLRALARRDEGVDDRVLAERARATLGRVVSHAHALAIDASRGVVTVSGPILRDEMRLALKTLTHVPGVRRVVNALEPHPAPRRIPALLGDRRLAWARHRGGGAARMAAALAGVAGVGLAARAAMNARNTQEIELRS